MSDSPPLLDKRKLRLRRVCAGLTQPELAERAKLHPSHISLLERGVRGTTPETLEILAGSLGCLVADLMPGLTPAQLADLAELHPSLILLLRRGGHGIPRATLNGAASVLGCPVADLLPDEVAA